MTWDSLVSTRTVTQTVIDTSVLAPKTGGGWLGADQLASADPGERARVAVRFALHCDYCRRRERRVTHVERLRAASPVSNNPAATVRAMGLLHDYYESNAEAARCTFELPQDHVAQDELCLEVAGKLRWLAMPTHWLWDVEQLPAQVIKRTFQVDLRLLRTNLGSVAEGWPIWRMPSMIRTREDLARSEYDPHPEFFLGSEGDTLRRTQWVSVNGTRTQRGDHTRGGQDMRSVVYVDGAERTVTDTRVLSVSSAWVCEVPGHSHRAYAKSVDELLEAAVFSIKRLGWGVDVSRVRP